MTNTIEKELIRKQVLERALPIVKTPKWLVESLQTEYVTILMIIELKKENEKAANDSYFGR